MKIYKEHLILGGAVIAALLLVTYLFVTNSFDNSATVDGLKPVPVKVIANNQ